MSVSHRDQGRENCRPEYDRRRSPWVGMAGSWLAQGTEGEIQQRHITKDLIMVKKNPMLEGLRW